MTITFNATPAEASSLLQMVAGFGASNTTALAAVQANQQQILATLTKILAAIQQENLTMAALDTSITQLTSDVTGETTVVGSAVTLISGFQTQLAAAVAAAQAAGATATQLSALTALDTTLQQNNAALAAAVAANTPAAPPNPGP